MANPRELILLDRAHQALAQAQTVDEIKEVRDRSQAVRAYVKKARMGKKLAVDVAILRLLAERKLGQMLDSLPLAKASPGNQYTPKRARPPRSDNGPVYLCDLDITESDSCRAQRIAAIPNAVFEKYISTARKKETEPTVAAALRLAKKHSPPRRRTASQASPVPTLTMNALISTQKQFSTLYTRPEWPRVKNRTSPTLLRVLNQLRDEPVHKLAKPRAHLHIHTPTFFLPETMLLIDTWGFSYASCLVMSGPKKTGGRYWDESIELLLLGVRGGMRFSNPPTASTVSSNADDPFLVLRTRIEHVSPGPYLALHLDKGSEAPGWTLVR